MTADRPAGSSGQRVNQRDKPRLALDNPADLAWGAKLLQVAMERRKRRLAASRRGKRHVA